MQASHRIEKVQRLLQEQVLDAIIVRDTSDLFWLTGFENVFDSEQAHVAIITRSECILHTDSRYATAMQEQAADEGVWRIDATRVQEVEFLERMLKELKLVTGRIAINDAMPLKLYRAYSDAMPNARFKERSDDILRLRAVKDRHEIAIMQEAQRVASQAFLETIASMQPGMTEHDVSIALEFNMKRLGATELAFANIVASGPNGAKPHAIPSERVIEQGDLIVFDFGARVGGYCSDTTRTVCVGRASEDQLAAYEAVKKANQAVADAIMPGVSGAEMQNVALRTLAKEGYDNKMGHSVGHGVGIDVHELPRLASKNNELLVVGNVVTNEPGVYLPGEFGIRIEDCGLVTEDGFQSFCDLTRELVVVS